MKKKLISVFLFIIFTALYANDTFYYIAGGNLIPAEQNQTNVEMKEETINIELFDDHYTVTADFIFYNNGQDENLLVGFPYLLQTQQGGSTNASIYDFKTWVNDKLIEHTNYPIEIPEKGNGEIVINSAFTKKVFFPSKEITKTKVEYKAGYGSAAPSYRIASYYYGSGRAWYNSIGKMIINIKNKNSKYDEWIYDIQMPQIGYGNYSSNIPVENYVNWNNGYLQIQINTIEPNENDTIAIWIGDPLWNIGPRIFRPERFTYRTQLLSNRELAILSSSQLRILRNAFYAFYGYNFKDEYLKEYFRNFDKGNHSDSFPAWYVLNEKFNENMLSEIERNNINRILEEVKRR
jgi:hypothetical protein